MFLGVLAAVFCVLFYFGVFAAVGSFAAVGCCGGLWRPGFSPGGACWSLPCPVVVVCLWLLCSVCHLHIGFLVLGAIGFPSGRLLLPSGAPFGQRAVMVETGRSGVC